MTNSQDKLFLNYLFRNIFKSINPTNPRTTSLESQSFFLFRGCFTNTIAFLGPQRFELQRKVVRDTKLVLLDHSITPVILLIHIKTYQYSTTQPPAHYNKLRPRANTTMFYSIDMFSLYKQALKLLRFGKN